MTLGQWVHDRRRYKRVNFDLPVKLKSLSRLSPLQIQNSISKDISEGGMQISSFYFYPVNHKLMLEVILSENSASLQSQGKVVWISQMPYQERYSVGIEFSELNEDSRIHLKRVICDYDAVD